MTYLSTTPSRSFCIISVNIFFLKSLTHEKINRVQIFANMKLTTYSRLTREQARKHDSHL